MPLQAVKIKVSKPQITSKFIKNSLENIRKPGGQKYPG